MTKPPYRLTYLIDGLNIGGAQVGMARLLSKLDPDRFNVTVVGLDGKDGGILPLLPGHVTVVNLDIKPKYRLDRLTPLWRLLGETEILVTSLFHSLAIGATLGYLRGVPRVLCWQNSAEHTSGLRQRISRISFAACDRILADSEAVASMLRGDGFPGSDISVVPIAGVDLETYRLADAPSEDEVVRVGSIGQLIPAKNYEILIRCAAQIGEGFEFHIVGDGPRRDELETLARKHAPETVTFHGERPPREVPSFLSELDVYFQPSRREGLCITVIEAMACGLPVVGSRAGGISESVVHGETGLLASANAIDKHCEHLRTFGEDDALRRQYGQASRERVAENYSAEALREGFLDAVSQASGKQ